MLHAVNSSSAGGVGEVGGANIGKDGGSSGTTSQSNGSGGDCDAELVVAFAAAVLAAPVAMKPAVRSCEPRRVVWLKVVLLKGL